MKKGRWGCDVCIIVIYLAAAMGLLILKDAFTIKPGEDGVTQWSQGWLWETPETGELIPVEPGEQVAVSTGQAMVLKNRLPEVVKHGTDLCFRSAMQSVRVWIGGELVHEYGMDVGQRVAGSAAGWRGTLRRRLSQAPDSTWNHVYLSDKKGGQEVVVEFISPYHVYSGQVRTFYTGDYDAVQKYLVRMYFPGFVAGLVMLVMGITMVILADLMKRKGFSWEMSRYMGLFTLVVAFWTLCESKIPVEYWYLNSKFLACLVLLAGPVFYVKYLNVRTGRRYERAAKRMLAVTGVNAAVVVALAAFGIADLVESLPCTHGMIILVILFSGYVWLGEWKLKDRDVTDEPGRAYHNRDGDPANPRAMRSGHIFRTLRMAGTVGLMGAVLMEGAVFYLNEFASTGAYVQTALLLYILILFVNFMNDTLEEMKRAGELELKLEESRVRMMLSQIQPHFLYNTLLAIQDLCYTEPRLAADTIVTFADYLRTNMDFLQERPLVPFREELTHVENYMEIQKIRFGDELKFVEDIQTVDFVIPPLSVQPLVENAVEHGLRERRGNGTVRLTVGAEDGDIVILVEDDGCGFDGSLVDEKPWDVPEAGGNPAGGNADEEKREFRALGNVRKRLERLLDGTLCVESENGRGSRVTLRFPAERRL